jgi:hypothetical protein
MNRAGSPRTFLRGFGRLDVFPMGDAHISLDEVLLELGDMRGMLYFHRLLGKLRGFPATLEKL